jgi:hypothetical protein
MITTDSYSNRPAGKQLIDDTTRVLPIYAESRWLDVPEPIWKPATEAVWFEVVLPFLHRRSRTIWAKVYLWEEVSGVGAKDVIATRLRAFYDWLDSLPPAPPIPLEALNGENLYG